MTIKWKEEKKNESTSERKHLCAKKSQRKRSDCTESNDNLAFHKFAEAKRRKVVHALCHGSVICLQIHRKYLMMHIRSAFLARLPARTISFVLSSCFCLCGLVDFLFFLWFTFVRVQNLIHTFDSFAKCAWDRCCNEYLHIRFMCSNKIYSIFAAISLCSNCWIWQRRR